MKSSGPNNLINQILAVSFGLGVPYNNFCNTKGAVIWESLGTSAWELSWSN